MDYRGVEICCPRCHGELAWVDAAQADLRCEACEATYPVVASIPDLRVFPDPYIAAEDDRAKGVALAGQLDGRSFSELIDYYYSTTSVVPPQHAALYKQGLLGAEGKAGAALAMWETRLPDVGNGSGALLDVGCGTGPLLVAARSHFTSVVGVDIAFRWLQVGRKRLEEAGVDAVLICACAEALPFPGEAFDAVAADSTVELLRDQRAGLAEARRVLRTPGALMLATPNRFSLGPDPHTGLLAGGWLPDGVTAWYMRRRNAIPPVRRLLSAGSVRRLVGDANFAEVDVFLPDFPPEQLRYLSAALRAAVGAYHALNRAPGGAQLLKLIGPRLLVTARPR